MHSIFKVNFNVLYTNINKCMNSKLWNTIKINIYLRSHASKWKIIHRIDRLAHNSLTLIDFRLKLKILNICTPKLHSNYYWAKEAPNGFCYLTYIILYNIYIVLFQGIPVNFDNIPAGSTIYGNIMVTQLRTHAKLIFHYYYHYYLRSLLSRR